MKYQISIPNPCNEKWSEMTHTDTGAFCENCQKEVLDFTNKSKYQLAQLLATNQNLCGKFKPEQLNIDIASLKYNRPSKIGLLLGVSTLVSIASPVFSQNKILDTKRIEQIDKDVREFNHPEKTSDSIQIEGRVVYNNIPLPGANVYFKEASYGTQADFDGNFVLSASIKMMETNPTLLVSYIGFETQEIEIDKNSDFLNIEMTEGYVTMGIVVVHRQNIFKRIGSLFRKKNKESCD